MHVVPDAEMIDLVGAVHRFILLFTCLENTWNASQTSVFVSRILDYIGYDRAIVQYRQLLFTNKRLEDTSDDNICHIYAGSKAEGISKILVEGDLDLLRFPSDIICTTNPQQFLRSEAPLTVFRLEQNDTAPGYTRLVLEKCTSDQIDCLICVCKSLDGKLYLCSDEWRNIFRRYIARNYKLRNFSLEQYDCGPSIPVQAFNGFLHGDNVLGIICDCPNILQPWLDRPRNYNWPSADVIREISTMEGYVVPVGYKGSSRQNIEWRICFTKAEIKLVQSLNDSQLKLIIMLKMVAKIWLKPICKEMTTYVMKNLVLWIVEGLPADYFTETRLLQTLSIALRVLKQCLCRNKLPSYMIPERNLLAHRVTAGQRNMLCLMIDILQGEGPLKLLEWDRLGYAVISWAMWPEAFFWLSEKRSELEIIVLYYNLLGPHSENTKRRYKEQAIKLFQTSVLPIIVYLYHLNETFNVSNEAM